MAEVLGGCAPGCAAARNLVMVLAGVFGLLLKGWLRPSLSSFVYSYLGNVTVSFAVYFVAGFAAVPWLKRAWIAVIALFIVEAFELTNGFGVMTNVYDPYDYLANAAGVVLAVGVDIVMDRVMKGRGQTGLIY